MSVFIRAKTMKPVNSCSYLLMFGILHGSFTCISHVLQQSSLWCPFWGLPDWFGKVTVGNFRIPGKNHFSPKANSGLGFRDPTPNSKPYTRTVRFKILRVLPLSPPLSSHCCSSPPAATAATFASSATTSLTSRT